MPPGAAGLLERCLEGLAAEKVLVYCSLGSSVYHFVSSPEQFLELRYQQTRPVGGAGASLLPLLLQQRGVNMSAVGTQLLGRGGDGKMCSSLLSSW